MGLIKQQFGFSLMEILVAVGILAFMVATVMPAVQMAGRKSVEDTEMLKAVFLANNKMVELEQEITEDMERGKFPNEISRSGEFTNPFTGYSWEYSIKKVEIPVVGTETEGQSVAVVGVIKTIMKEISKAVREIKLTVTWGEDEDKEDLNTFTLTTHIVNLK